MLAAVKAASAPGETDSSSAAAAHIISAEQRPEAAQMEETIGAGFPGAHVFSCLRLFLQQLDAKSSQARSAASSVSEARSPSGQQSQLNFCTLTPQQREDPLTPRWINEINQQDQAEFLSISSKN